MADLPECKALLVQKKNSRLYVTINRPETRNALSAEVVEELIAVCDAVAPDRDLRCLILRGAGGTFCAGGDIKGFQQSFSAPAPGPGEKDPIAISNRSYGDFLIKFNNLPQTVVGVVEGAAFGGGLGLACVTDVTLCTVDTRFAMSETGLGIPPAQIAPFVAQRIGRSNARLLALTGTRFKGERAKALGLVHFVAASPEDLDAQLTRVLNEIGRCAPGANAATKAILMNREDKPLHALLDDAAEAFATALRGPEGQAGVAAFLQKKDADWVEKVD